MRSWFNLILLRFLELSMFLLSSNVLGPLQIPSSKCIVHHVRQSVVTMLIMRGGYKSQKLKMKMEPVTVQNVKR